MPTALTGPGNVTASGLVTTGPLTAAKPSGTSDGDLLVAVPYVRQTGATFTSVPDGWSPAIVYNANGTIGVYVKPIPAAAAEVPTSYSWTASAIGGRAVLAIFRVTGADLSAPIDAVGPGTVTGTSSIVLPAVTAASAAALLLAVATMNIAGAPSDITPDAAMSEVTEAQIQSGSSTSVNIAQQQLDAIGTTGTRTATATGTTSVAGVMLTIKAAVRTVTGSASADLGGITASATGRRATTGTAAATFGPLTASASGRRTVRGLAAALLGALSATTTGRRMATGSATAVLGALTATATGHRAVTGTAVAPLDGITATATGRRTVHGHAAATLGSLAAASTGRRTVTATATAALGSLAATATGTTSGPGIVVGSGTAHLGALAATATGRRTVHGTAAANLGGLAAAATVPGPDTDPARLTVGAPFTTWTTGAPGAGWSIGRPYRSPAHAGPPSL